MPDVVLTPALTEAFLEKMQKENKSMREIRESCRVIESLVEMAQEKDNLLTGELLLQWREAQKQRGISKGTLTNQTVRINRFLRYLGAEDLCFQNGRKKDLRGQKFGNLLVLESTNNKSSDRSICWRCRCEACGKEKEIPANQLKKGVQISCGCGKSRRLQETNGYIDDTCLKLVFSDKISRNNTSGHKGVYLKRGKWAAQIQYKKKIYRLGVYDRLEDAVKARRLAEEAVREDAESLIKKIKETKETVSGKDKYDNASEREK